MKKKKETKNPKKHSDVKEDMMLLKSKVKKKCIK